MKIKFNSFVKYTVYGLLAFSASCTQNEVRPETTNAFFYKSDSEVGGKYIEVFIDGNSIGKITKAGAKPTNCLSPLPGSYIWGAVEVGKSHTFEAKGENGSSWSGSFDAKSGECILRRML